MIEFGNAEPYGFEHAVRGMRNSFNSWDKSDSDWIGEEYNIGKVDLELMHKLYQAGPDHAKFLRQIQLWVDIKAPLYWWKQMDQYSVGVTSNSTSTMHKIQEEEFTLGDFSCEHLETQSRFFDEDTEHEYYNYKPYMLMKEIVNCLEACRQTYNRTGNKTDWWQMIQLLPSSYNQLRTLNLNYAVLAHAYKSRKGHRLDEWQVFREWAESLPYFKAIVCGE